MMIKIAVLLECLQLGREDCPTYSSSSKNAVADNLTDDPDISSHKMRRGGEREIQKEKWKIRKWNSRSSGSSSKSDNSDNRDIVEVTRSDAAPEDSELEIRFEVTTPLKMFNVSDLGICAVKLQWKAFPSIGLFLGSIWILRACKSAGCTSLIGGSAQITKMEQIPRTLVPQSGARGNVSLTGF